MLRINTYTIEDTQKKTENMYSLLIDYCRYWPGDAREKRLVCTSITKTPLEPYTGRAARTTGRAWNTEKVNGPDRDGPFHSYWLNIITMVRKAQVGLMVLAAGFPRSFKSGLT